MSAKNLKTFGAVGAALLGVYCYTNNTATKKSETSENINEFIAQPTNLKSTARNNVNNHLSTAILKSKKRIQGFQVLHGVPGLVVGVSVDGKTVWEEGFGFSNIENNVRCTPGSVMRIASISKSITMIAVAKLWENGKIDLDKPIQHYVKSFPEKTYKEENVIITGHHLVSHTSGIRHYRKDKLVTISDGGETEFLLNKNFETIEDALKLFKEDDLLLKPGSGYLYTTHGWTLLGAMVESVVHSSFEKYMEKLFTELGMDRTYFDRNRNIIVNRASYYSRNKATGKLENAPTVDNSYKFAGGGILSCVSDLTRFGNIMLYSYQHDEKKQKEHNRKLKPGFLKTETVTRLWTPNPITIEKDSKSDSYYGMGWSIKPPQEGFGFCKEQQLIAEHSGGAVGCSSILVIIPRPFDDNSADKDVSGVVVTILTNLQDIQLYNLASSIAEYFYK